MKTATTIKQAKRLRSIGIDTNTADMRYSWTWDRCIENKKKWVLCTGKAQGDDVPAWSLSALIGVIPEGSLDKYGETYNMDFAFNGLFTDCHSDPIDAAVEMVEMMLAKGLIKKGVKHEGK